MVFAAILRAFVSAFGSFSVKVFVFEEEALLFKGIVIFWGIDDNFLVSGSTLFNLSLINKLISLYSKMFVMVTAPYFAGNLSHFRGDLP